MKTLSSLLITFCFFVNVYSAALEEPTEKEDRYAVLRSEGFLVVPRGTTTDMKDTFAGKDMPGAEKIYLLDLASGEVDALEEEFKSSSSKLKRLSVEICTPPEFFPILNALFRLASRTPHLEELHLIGNHKNLGLSVIQKGAQEKPCIRYFSGDEKRGVGAVERFARDRGQGLFMKMMEKEYPNIKILFSAI
jgi:hypothetical protein